MKNNKKLILLVIVIFSFSALPGCWDNIDIEKFLLVKAVGLDTAEEHNRIKVTVQSLIHEGGGGEEEGEEDEESVTASATGYSITEALRNLRKETGKRLYLGYNEIIVISEELAREGIRKHIDFFTRHREIDLRTNILVANNRAEDVLDIPHPVEELPAKAIEDLIALNRDTLFSFDLRDFLIAFKEEERDPMSGRIKMKDEEEEILLIYGGAIFDNDKMVEFLTRKEARGANWVFYPETVDGVLTLMNPRDKTDTISVQVLTADNNITVDTTESGELQAKIELNVEGGIEEHQERSYDLSKSDNIRQLNYRMSQLIENEILTFIELSQEHGVDTVGFGDHLYRNNPNVYYNLKDDWDEVYLNLDIIVKVESEIRRTGLVRQ